MSKTIATYIETLCDDCVHKDSLDKQGSFICKIQELHLIKGLDECELFEEDTQSESNQFECE